MTTEARACLPLIDANGRAVGELAIALLPQRARSPVPALIVETQDSESCTERVQLLEGYEYLYEISGGEVATTDRTELFAPDDNTGCRGRLRTALATGRVEVVVQVDGTETRPIAFEVRSSKLDYLKDYRWMLGDIAELSAALVLERFAPSEQRLRVDDATDAETIYQRFVLLQALLEGERLGLGLRRILAEPHVQWQVVHREVVPGRGVRGSGRLARQLAAAGPRIAWPSPRAGLAMLPHRMVEEQTQETVDNAPNRFVLFALREWRALVAKMLDALEAEKRRAAGRVSVPVQRGLSEGALLAAQLDEFMRAPLFDDVGRLDEFPASNQVLLRKAGYREVLNAYFLVELGAELAWSGGTDVFGGGQRNVAALYEFWVFLELAKIVSSLCDEPLDLTSLIAEGNSGMSLVLRRGRTTKLTGSFERYGRSFSVELWFNREFASGRDGSWTRTMRPDCSLHILPKASAPYVDDLWLHFDAKYRAERAEDLLGGADGDGLLAARPDDLYKMHAYRDAIVRAVGAYVIFPGNREETREQFDEVLPGLGAFPLRPSSHGTAEGHSSLCAFLRQVLNHVANQTTRHERLRHWGRTIAQGPKAIEPRMAAPFLRAPPADEPVLIGYVKSIQHHAWIRDNRLYNLRADSGRRGAVGLSGEELSAGVLALYGELGDGETLYRIIQEPRLLSSAELVEMGYPEPRGSMYFCLELELLRAVPSWWNNARIQALAEHCRGLRPFGSALVVSWHDVALASIQPTSRENTSDRRSHAQETAAGVPERLAGSSVSLASRQGDRR